MRPRTAARPSYFFAPPLLSHALILAMRFPMRVTIRLSATESELQTLLAVRSPAPPLFSAGANRGKNDKDQRSFAFAQAFGREMDSAQPCCLSAPERTDANGCTESTSWGSLVRAQYRPSKSLTSRFPLSHKATDRAGQVLIK